MQLEILSIHKHFLDYNSETGAYDSEVRMYTARLFAAL